MTQFYGGALEPGALELGGVEGFQLKRQVRRGDFSGIRQLLRRTRENEDWQDRHFMLNIVVPEISYDALESACASEPRAQDLALLRFEYLADQVFKKRGTRRADETSEAQFATAAESLKQTLDCLANLIDADPGDPIPLVTAMSVMVVFNDLHSDLKQMFQRSIQIAPDFVSAYATMAHAASERWGGTHEESLSIARLALRRARPGNDLYSCVFYAHTMVYGHLIVFDEDYEGAYNYRNNPQVEQELNQAFDQWVASPYQPRRSSIPYMHDAACWFLHAEQNVRLKQALDFTQNVYSKYPWATLGNPDELLAEARQIAATVTIPPPKKGGLFGWFRA